MRGFNLNRNAVFSIPTICFYFSNIPATWVCAPSIPVTETYLVDLDWMSKLLDGDFEGANPELSEF